MNIYKDISKGRYTMNDIKPTTGLPMSSGGIDVGGTPYGANPISNNSSNFNNNTYC